MQGLSAQDFTGLLLSWSGCGGMQAASLGFLQSQGLHSWAAVPTSWKDQGQECKEWVSGNCLMDGSGVGGVCDWTMLSACPSLQLTAKDTHAKKGRLSPGHSLVPEWAIHSGADGDSGLCCWLGAGGQV